MKTIRVVVAVIYDGNKIFATARGYGEYRGHFEAFGSGRLSDRDAIIQKKEMEHAQAVINEIYRNGL